MGAFVDLGDLRIPEEPLNGEFLGVAIASQDLDGALRDPHRRVACEQFGHARFFGMTRAVGVVMLFFGPSGLVDEKACGFNLSCHVSQIGHNHLMISDGFSEGLALVSVFEGRFVGTLGDSQRLGRNANSTVVKGVHGDGEAVAYAFDSVLYGHLAVVQHKGAGVRRTNAEFVFFLSNGEPFIGSINDERRGSSVLL